MTYGRKEGEYEEDGGETEHEEGRPGAEKL